MKDEGGGDNLERWIHENWGKQKGHGTIAVMDESQTSLIECERQAARQKHEIMKRLAGCPPNEENAA